MNKAAESQEIANHDSLSKTFISHDHFSSPNKDEINLIEMENLSRNQKYLKQAPLGFSSLIEDNHIGRISNGSSTVEFEGVDGIHHDGNVLKCLMPSMKDKTSGDAGVGRNNDELRTQKKEEQENVDFFSQEGPGSRQPETWIGDLQVD